MVHIPVFPGVNDYNFVIVTRLPVLQLDNVIGLSYSHLLAYDDLNDRFNRLLCDTDGRLFVSTSPNKADEANHSMVVADADGEGILVANLDRKLFVIQNVGAVDAYISFGEATVIATAQVLSPGIALSSESWIGSIFCKTLADTTELRVLEVS